MVLNGEAVRWMPPWQSDDRITIHRVEQLRGVGAAKAYACEKAHGKILVELDHDDVLSWNALASIVALQEDTGAGFFYSDTAEVTEELKKSDNRWDARYGWRYKDVGVNGRKFRASVAFQPSPHNASFIWWGPNHVRAFTREAYEAAGGYDANRTVLDDQDLMCRLFQHTEFAKHDGCLYLQRMHPGNTQVDPDINAQIQRECIELHDKYIEPMSLAWAKRQGLEALDLGGEHSCPEGWTPVDKNLAEGKEGHARDVFDVLADMKDGSVGAIRAVDFIEHVADSIRLWNEMYRVLAPSGMLLIEVPSTDGRGAWQDPTHCSFFNENSFWYVTSRDYQKFCPEITARFQVSRLTSYFPSDWHRNLNIPYVRAHLVAPKDGPRQGGEVFWLGDE